MIEFGAGGAIMHSEEPTTTTEPQPAETAETPAVDDSVPPAAMTGPAGGDQPTPAAVPESVAGNADSSTVEPPEMAARPASLAVSVPVPSQAGPASPVAPTPIDPPAALPPQNPRRKRRAKGWSCPVCRQRKRPRIRIPHLSPTRFFDPLTDAPPIFPSSLHILAADYDHPSGDGRRQGRKARLDVDL